MLQQDEYFCALSMESATVLLIPTTVIIDGEILS